MTEEQIREHLENIRGDMDLAVRDLESILKAWHARRASNGDMVESISQTLTKLIRLMARGGLSEH